MNANGWSQLDCCFFTEACREALGVYLDSQGFTERRLTNGGGVVYGRADLLLEFNYDTNLFPEYTTRVAVGYADREFGTRSGVSSVPMWYVIRKDHPYRTRVYWTFCSKDDLLRVLEEVRTEFLEPTLMPLLQDRDRLDRVIRAFRADCGI
jgi:hypothetical protein